MHTIPPLAIAPHNPLTIVSPDADLDNRVIPYQHILAFAQVVKEEQLAAGPTYYAGRDSLNSTPDMYEHPNGDAYISSIPSYQVVNTPLSPLSSSGVLPSNALDARVPSLSPSPVEEHVPEGMGVPYVPTPPVAPVPHSAPHDQFQFTNPFLPTYDPTGGMARYGIPDRYVPAPDRRMSEPTLASHASTTIATAAGFLSTNTRLSAHDARVKALATGSPTPSSPPNPPASWTPPVVPKHEPDSHHHGALYGVPGTFSAGPEAYHAVAHPGTEPEPVSPLHSNSAYSASGSETGHHIGRPDAQSHSVSQGGAYLSSSQPTPVASHPPETAVLPSSASATDIPYSPSMTGDHSREDPSSPDHSSSKTYSFVPLPGNAVRKRPRRRYDEIERLYRCNFLLPSGEECSKAYGTLNHLNAHIQMQRHGEKRSPTEFKDLRKQWRKAKKDAELSVAQERVGMSSVGSPSDVGHGGRPHLGLRIPSDFGPEVIQSPTHLLSPSPIGPPSFGYPTPGGGAGYMHESHTAPRGAGAVYPSIATPASSAYGLATLPEHGPSPSDLRPVPMHHDERVGHSWASPTPTQSGPRYRYSDDRRFSLPGRPSLSNRSSWASEYGNEYEGSSAHEHHLPPPSSAHSPMHPGYMQATHYSYGGDSGYSAASYAPPPPAHGQDLQPTQEELERFPPTATLLTPLPGYVAPPLDLGHHDLPPPSYRPVTSSATTLLAPIPALSHSWRREEPDAHDSHYHGGRQM